MDMKPPWGSAGRIDIYGIALTTQPGKSQGRPFTKAGSQPIVQDRPAHADSPGTPCPDGRTVQPGRSPVTRTRTTAPTNFIPGTNAIESLNARFRQATRRRGHFPDPDAALKVLYLVIQDHRPNRKNVDGKTVGWKSVINTLTLYYEDRITIDN